MKWHTEVRKLSELKEWDINPRTISQEEYKELKQSVEKLGNWDSLVINTDGTVIAGNQRLKVHKDNGDKEIEVRVPDKKLTEKEMKEIGLKSNRHSGEWDMDKLAEGFEDVLEELGADDLMPEIVEEVEEDDYEEPEDLETTVVLGDVYQLGEHRLVCGDSTKIEDVEKLMNGEKADMVFTDPPYGMDLDTDYTGLNWGDRKGKKYDAVIGDKDDFVPELITKIFDNFGYCKEMFLWGADYYFELIPEFKKGHYIVWDKTLESNGDADSNSEYELLWTKQKHKRIVMHFNWFRYFGLHQQDQNRRIHPTQKPLQVLTPIIEKYSKEKGIIVDLFGGSGSTLIACEQTNRKCYMMELDPHYCQVIIDRWEKLTNMEAKKL